MVIISHRGNLNGSVPEFENSVEYINKAIEVGFDVEIDVWCVDDKLFLGHDKPTYQINYKWLFERKDKLWIHCKNVDSVVYFNNSEFNYFYHENDLLTLTSKNHMWVYPNNQPIINSIAVLPELNNDDISKCFGICTDYPLKYV